VVDLSRALGACSCGICFVFRAHEAEAKAGSRGGLALQGKEQQEWNCSIFRARSSNRLLKFCGGTLPEHPSRHGIELLTACTRFARSRCIPLATTLRSSLHRFTFHLMRKVPFMTIQRSRVIAVVGLLAGEIGGALIHFPPFYPQRFLHHWFASVAVMLFAIGTFVSLLLWAQLSHDFERLAFALAIISVCVLVVVVNVVAPAVGWWKGPVFQAPLLPLAFLTGVRAAFQLALVLLLYRWVARYLPRIALVIYTLILLALIPGTFYADERLLRSGVLFFVQGYTVGYDVVMGEVIFALPVVIYEILRHHWCAHS
jgi:hypothetical protein